MKTIDLDKFRTIKGSVKSKVFTGRDRGQLVRERSKIDEIFDGKEVVKLIIPDDIFSITPSFLEEFVENIVKNYGKDIVLSKLDLAGNQYDITEPLQEAIDRILQTKTGLDV